MNKAKGILRHAAALLIIAVLVIVPASVFAVTDDVPTLFHNDEEWYKDGLYPLSVRDGNYYVPAELFAMFDYISVTNPSPDNILIHNTESGLYASILFSDSTAAVNGAIVDDVGVFRDEDMYYVDVKLVCNAIEMGYETYILPDGKLILRLLDDDVSHSFEHLAGEYLPDNEGEENTDPRPQSNVTKWIFLICEPEGKYPGMYSAHMHLKEYGLNCTLFLTPSSSAEDILGAMALGEYGVMPESLRRPDGIDIARTLDGINSTAIEYTGRKARLTLSTGNAVEDEILRSMGYIPIEPDFSVNGSSDAEALFAEIIVCAAREGHCTVFLEDCWNSMRIAELISEITDPGYMTSNLINANR